MEKSLLNSFDKTSISDQLVGKRSSKNEILTDMFRLLVHYKWWNSLKCDSPTRTSTKSPMRKSKVKKGKSKDKSKVSKGKVELDSIFGK